jgi:hypothetical protein
MIKIAGIKRKKIYSPNHVINDALIFSKTVERLNQLDVSVEIYEEDDVERIKEELIFSMARDNKTINRLLKTEGENKKIINSPIAEWNCLRVNMVGLLTKNNIPFPLTVAGEIDYLKRISFEQIDLRKVWIKRGDVHAIHKEDVIPVFSEEEKNNILDEFKRREIDTAILQKHIEGKVVKFYAVYGTDFFETYFSDRTNNIDFDKDKLKHYAAESAEAVGLDIYGGDAIISPNGDITIIDINDWPSFAPVRDEASIHIASFIYNKLKESTQLQNQRR